MPVAYATPATACGTCVNRRAAEKVVDLLPALSHTVRHSVHKFGQLGHSPSAVAWLASIPILIPISIRIRNPVATSAVRA